MSLTTLCAAPAWKQSSLDPFYIDGIPVCDLFDRLYDETREIACRFEQRVSFDVISWSDLTVAADEKAIREVLNQAIRWCLSSDDTASIMVRAHPCHEDVWTVFDIQADLRCDSCHLMEAWQPTFASLRKLVHRMGGEWESISTSSECRRISFRLPQWITPVAELKKRLQFAS
jgi:hypothetical protein